MEAEIRRIRLDKDSSTLRYSKDRATRGKPMGDYEIKIPELPFKLSSRPGPGDAAEECVVAAWLAGTGGRWALKVVRPSSGRSVTVNAERFLYGFEVMDNPKFPEVYTPRAKRSVPPPPSKQPDGDVRAAISNLHMEVNAIKGAMEPYDDTALMQALLKMDRKLDRALDKLTSLNKSVHGSVDKVVSRLSDERPSGARLEEVDEPDDPAVGDHAPPGDLQRYVTNGGEA